MKYDSDPYIGQNKNTLRSRAYFVPSLALGVVAFLGLCDIAANVATNNSSASTAESQLPTLRLLCVIEDSRFTNPTSGERPAEAIEVTDKEVNIPGFVDAKCREALPEYWDETTEKNVQSGGEIDYNNIYFLLPELRPTKHDANLAQNTSRLDQIRLRRGDTYSLRRVSGSSVRSAPRYQRAYKTREKASLKHHASVVSSTIRKSIA